MNLLCDVFIAAVALILVIAVFFLVCRSYEEGVFGNFALGFMICVPAAIVLWDAWSGALQRPEPVIEVLVIGIAFMFARHAYRFIMFHWAPFLGLKAPQEGKGTVVPAAQRGRVLIMFTGLLAMIATAAVVWPIVAGGIEAKPTPEPAIQLTADEQRSLTWMRAHCVQTCAIVPWQQMQGLLGRDRALAEENAKLREAADKQKTADCS